MERAYAGRRGTEIVVLVGITAETGFLRATVHLLEGKVEYHPLRLARLSVGRGDNFLKIGTDSQAVQDRCESVIEV